MACVHVIGEWPYHPKKAPCFHPPRIYSCLPRHTKCPFFLSCNELWLPVRRYIRGFFTLLTFAVRHEILICRQIKNRAAINLVPPWNQQLFGEFFGEEEKDFFIERQPSTIHPSGSIINTFQHFLGIEEMQQQQVYVEVVVVTIYTHTLLKMQLHSILIDQKTKQKP